MVNCVRLKKRQKLDESSDTSSQPSPPPEIAGADPFGVFSAHIEPYMLDLFKFCEIKDATDIIVAFPSANQTQI